MTMRGARGCLIVLLLWLAAAPGYACPPSGYDMTALRALKASGFVVDDRAAKRALALDLVACLASPDPALRDGIAYEALTQWMRAGDLDVVTLRALRSRLDSMLDADAGQGFARPFAALVLSEVARTDRIAAWMPPKERGAMVDRAAAYLESVRDYRGYDASGGWRHGVAHGADWLMQLAMNPALERAQADRMLAAVATQVVPAAPHAYVFAEPERLLAPVLFIASRRMHTDAQWQAWFAALLARRDIGRKRAYADSGWLARRHDLMAFLTAAYVETGESRDAGVRALRPAIVSAIKAAR